MNNKKCKECNNDFESINTKGSEQLYCSKSCRNKSANKRFKNNLINNYAKTNNEIGNETSHSTINGDGTRTNTIYQGNETIKFNQSRNNIGIDSNILDCIKEKYEADISSVFYKLKCEQLEKEIAELKQEIIDLEIEIDDLSMENKEENNSIISGIMTSFKNDPQSTVTFATELITNFIKPKKTENV
jgi:hypothetical protein